MSTKPRPTDAEFEVLKRQARDELDKVVAAVCEKQGWDPAKVHVHASGGGFGDCYCACPDGPCQHIWDGPAFEDETTVSATCSRCGMPAINHDIRCMP